MFSLSSPPKLKFYDHETGMCGIEIKVGTLGDSSRETCIVLEDLERRLCAVQ